MTQQEQDQLVTEFKRNAYYREHVCQHHGLPCLIKIWTAIPYDEYVASFQPAIPEIPFVPPEPKPVKKRTPKKWVDMTDEQKDKRRQYARESRQRHAKKASR